MPLRLRPFNRRRLNPVNNRNFVTPVISRLMRKPANPFSRFLKRLGPGLITGASDDDPSGIATYSQAGAQFGFGTLWTVIAMLPLMIAVQHIAAKIGMVSGRGLAGVLRDFYSRKLLYPAVFGLLIANTINIGTDIAAIAAAINMFVPIPISILTLPTALLILGLQIWGSYRLIVKIFKWLTLSLFAYVFAAVLAKPDWADVIRATLLPEFQLNSDFLTMIVALLGTTISPYLLFWEASEEVEEEIAEGRTSLEQRIGATTQEITNETFDNAVGMIFSNVVAYFVILAAGATLFKAGVNDIQTASQAAEALRPLAGNLASVLFTLGIIGTGLLAVPVLAGSSAFAVSETFGWNAGLNEKPGRAIKFYGVIVASVLAGLLIDFTGINPISALFWTAVINGVVAPPLLILLMMASNNRKVMGKWTNSPLTNILGWLTAALMFAAAIAMFVTWGN
jgi:NRAMP (natural resistance-associated macrophage protein)-like metal ion transporter